MRELKNIQKKSSKLKKAAYFAVGALAFILLISAGRQIPYIGNRNGLDTANVSGVMRATRAFIVNDTFTGAKTGDFFRLSRSGTSRFKVDTSGYMTNGRVITDALLIGKTTYSGYSIDASNRIVSDSYLSAYHGTSNQVRFFSSSNYPAAGVSWTGIQFTSSPDWNMGVRSDNKNFFFRPTAANLRLQFMSSTDTIGGKLIFDQKGLFKITDGNNDSAMINNLALHVKSTSRMVLLCPMTQAQRDAISGTKEAGSEIYCTDCTASDASTGVKQVWNGSAWKNCW